MSATPTAPTSDADNCDVFITYAPRDREWAASLQNHLRDYGVLARPYAADRVRSSVLSRTPAIIVLWSGAASATSVLWDMDRYLDGDEPRVAGWRIFPVALDESPVEPDTELPASLDALAWISLGGSYHAGPAAERVALEEVASEIAQALDPAAAAPVASPWWFEVIDAGRQIGWAWALSPDYAVWSIHDGPKALPRAGARVLLRTAGIGMVETEALVQVERNPGLHDGLLLLALPSGLAAPSLGVGTPQDKRVVEMVAPRPRGARGRLAMDPRGELSVQSGIGEERAVVGGPIVDVASGRVLGVLGYRFSGRPRRLLRLPPIDVEDRPPTPPTQVDAPPSARVHTDRWTTDDELDYALYARAIEQFIRHRETEPPLVISVQGPWGQGKTSLMRMVQERLDAGHPDFSKRDASDAGADTPTASPPAAENGAASGLTFRSLLKRVGKPIKLQVSRPRAPRTVWFNAWKYQSSEALWAGLAHTLLEQLPARLPRSQRELFWLRLQQRRVDTAAIRRDVHRLAFERILPLLVGCGVALSLVVLAAAFDIVGDAVGAVGAMATVIAGGLSWAGAYVWAARRPLEGRYAQWVRQPEYGERMGYLHTVEHDVRAALELLAPVDAPLVVFIDDLDRCAPAKIGEVLEAINLFLSGDYPNCSFVLGIDTEVVAAAMEVVHHDVIRQLKGRHGELGWRFMDKFVQLPFVMPRLSPAQRQDFVRALLSAKPDDPAQRDAAEQTASQIATELRNKTVEPAEIVRRIGELDPGVAAAAPDAVRTLAEEAIAAGARAFDDADEEMTTALQSQMRFLSDNPRTIKRAVNLYRFYRFTAWARQASSLGLQSATPPLIARWIVVTVRWPSFVRWLQVNASDEHATVDVGTLVRQARNAGTHEEWRELISTAGGVQSWHQDAELWSFLRDDAQPSIDLAQAADCGLW